VAASHQAATAVPMEEKAAAVVEVEVVKQGSGRPAENQPARLLYPKPQSALCRCRRSLETALRNLQSIHLAAGCSPYCQGSTPQILVGTLL
jgi:hypothetical protein